MKLIMEQRMLSWPDNRMSEDEFFAFCMSNPEQQVERDKDGNILMMAPTNFESARHESAAITALSNWNNIHKTGYVLSSAVGFTLPNRAVRSPDAAWISHDRMSAVTKADRRKFPHVCPEFVIEIRSETDHFKPLQAKMEEYIENGALLGFLIDPNRQKAYVYHHDGSVEKFDQFNGSLTGSDILRGFELPLQLFIAD